MITSVFLSIIAVAWVGWPLIAKQNKPVKTAVKKKQEKKTGEFCPQCGNKVKPGDKFCSQCGAKTNQ